MIYQCIYSAIVLLLFPDLLDSLLQPCQISEQHTMWFSHFTGRTVTLTLGTTTLSLLLTLSIIITLDSKLNFSITSLTVFLTSTTYSLERLNTSISKDLTQEAGEKKYKCTLPPFHKASFRLKQRRISILFSFLPKNECCNARTQETEINPVLKTNGFSIPLS